MKKIFFSLLIVIAFIQIAKGQAVNYYTGSVSSSTSSGTTIISQSITLTRAGSVNLVGTARLDGGGFNSPTSAYVYVSMTGRGNGNAALFLTSGDYNTTLQAGSSYFRSANVPAGTYTVQLITSYPTAATGTLSGSMLVICENEDGEALARQVAAITSAYQLADSQLQALIDALTQRVSSLETSMTTAQTDISTLQGQVSTLQGQMTTANTNIASNTNEINNLKAMIAALQSDVAELKNKQVDLSAYQKKLSPFQRFGVPGLVSFGTSSVTTGLMNTSGFSRGGFMSGGNADKDLDMSFINAEGDK